MSQHEPEDRFLTDSFVQLRTEDQAGRPTMLHLLEKQTETEAPLTGRRFVFVGATTLAAALTTAMAAFYVLLPPPLQKASEPAMPSAAKVDQQTLVSAVQTPAPSPSPLQGRNPVPVPVSESESVPEPTPEPKPELESEAMPELKQETVPTPMAGSVPPPPSPASQVEPTERILVVAAEPLVDLDSTIASRGFADEFIGNLPVAGNFYQNALTLSPGVNDAGGVGSPSAHASRSRDFKAVVNGVSNVEPRAGGSEGYNPLQENEFVNTGDDPLSTFSIDVDTASYSNARRFLKNGALPPADSIRIEEWINYFDYDYPAPTGADPFSVHLELGECPWNRRHLLAKIGLQADWVPRSETAGSNLVFLIDVSGSMGASDKLPLVKQSMELLTEELSAADRVAIVVYAGSSGLVLESTSGAERSLIRQAVQRLGSGGGTAGASGIRLAYKVARDNFIDGGVNRVILATDGDFNVGVTGHAELLEIIQADAEQGIFLTALGFGTGNLQDGRLEQLADKGNGNYAYIDSIGEARKVLVDELEGTLYTVAKDVKIQVEFNPWQVAGYRLIGYENRKLAHADFNDDAKDAGEIGSGHSVTALYEIVPAGETLPRPEVDPLKYQQRPGLSDAARSREWLTVKLRYKDPEGSVSKLIERVVSGEPRRAAEASDDFDFAASVATFGMLLRGSEHAGDATLESVRSSARRGSRRDASGYRAEFVKLIDAAAPLMRPAE